MLNIILSDDGTPFDGSSPHTGSLGGAETAFVNLAEALARSGNLVKVFNNCKVEKKINGVYWKNLSQLKYEKCDLYISNRSTILLSKVRYAKKRVLWLHNPADYLLKFRNLRRLWWWKPTIIFSSNFHDRSYPSWAPKGGREIIPYGISKEFLNCPPLITAPKPQAIFTSNPQRSLDWLLDIWKEKIFTKVPSAQLHLYSSPKTYGVFGKKKNEIMSKVLKKAKKFKKYGVVINDVLPKKQLAKKIRKSRLLLYRGDTGETFCLALGESQAMGVPAVIQDIGCVAERIIPKKTGFIENIDDDFAQRAVAILTNDNLWRSLHKNALKTRANWTWDNAAQSFLKLIN